MNNNANNGADLYIQNKSLGENIIMTGKDTSGTEKTLLTLSPNDNAITTSGKFVSQKYKNITLNHSQALITDIPEGTAGIILVQNNTTTTSAALLTGAEGASDVSFIAGPVTEGDGFYASNMMHRVSVFFDNGYLKINNLTGSTASISAGFFSLD